jgi:outer membrane protein assembly factor BamB
MIADSYGRQSANHFHKRFKSMSTSDPKRTLRRISVALSITAMFIAASYGLSERVAAVAYIAVFNPEPAWFQSASPVELYRGNTHRTGVYESGSIRQLTGMKWQTSFGRIAHAGPVFADGAIYLPTDDGRVRAIDSATGQLRWSFKAKPAGQVFSSVAVADGVVYVGIEKKRLFALDSRTGEKLWKFKAKGTIYTAPLVVNDTIYFASADGSFYAVNLSTHEQKWKINTHRRSLWHAVFDNGTITFAAENGLYAVNAETGAQKWQIEKASAQWWTAPALDGGILYIGNNDRSFYAINTETGAILWSASAGGDVWSGPAVTNGVVYVGNQDGNVYAFNSQTGERLWQFQAEDWAVSDPIIADGVIYFGVGNHEGRDGERYFYALDAQTGEKLWQFKADNRLLTAAAIGNGAIYVGSYDGTLYALQ